MGHVVTSLIDVNDTKVCCNKMCWIPVVAKLCSVCSIEHDKKQWAFSGCPAATFTSI